MTGPTIGELFAGYGGLGLGVTAALGGHVTWYSENDPGACQILAHRLPGIPNLGDITLIDWTTVPRVDILTGGSPCQDISNAGRRAGMTDGTRSNLWVAMREAIAHLRPSLVVWENVRGAFTAPAASSLEPCPGCVGDRLDQSPLSALGRVLGDLSDLGYDAVWHGLPASDIGAPHGRFRVFVVAHPRGEELARWAGLREGGPEGIGRGRPGHGSHPANLLPTPTTQDAANTGGPSQFERNTVPLNAAVTLLPSPRASDGEKGGPNQRGSSGDLMLPSAAMRLLPTPDSSNFNDGQSVEAYRERKERELAKGYNGNGGGTPLAMTVRLLPTPGAADGDGGHLSRSGERGDELLLGGVVKAHAEGRLLPTPRASDGPGGTSHGRTWSATDRSLHTVVHLGEVNTAAWGEYAECVARWEAITRPAPEPTAIGPKGGPRLAPAFSEWMMGLPAGWVTDPDIWRGFTDKKGKPASDSAIRNAQLHALGNGVVPQQAAAAVTYIVTTAARMAVTA